MKQAEVYGFTGGDKAPDDVNKAEALIPTAVGLTTRATPWCCARSAATFPSLVPLNGGDPYKDSKWNVLAGMSFAEVRPINFAGDSRPYGVSTNKRKLER